LVNYYYCWKKSNEAFKPKKGNGVSAKKSIFSQPKRPQRAGNGGSELQLVDYDSLSENEESDGERACHHCYSLESQDWHHSGYERQLLCTVCRHHFKRYGTMREVDRPADIPSCLLREDSVNGVEEGEEGVKTRASNRRMDRDKRTPNNEDDRTPIKNGTDLESDRRSTPQRLVKAVKRNYNPSTSSADEVITKLF
jgi:arginine-glutamic acid dipeptide repeat-containing protein